MAVQTAEVLAVRALERRLPVQVEQDLLAGVMAVQVVLQMLA